MKKSVKGALAGGAAAALLLGGAGTLAYWTADGTVTGSDIASGHLALTANGCDGWKLDGETTTYDSSTDKVVPGDTLTQVCTYTVDAVGKHITASLDVSAPTAWQSSNGLTSELTPSATYKVGSTTVSGSNVSVSDGDVVTATVSVDFDGPAATNGSEDLTGHLNDITVTATQGHTP